MGGMGAGGGKERRGDAAAGGQGDCGGGATSEGIAVSSDPFLFPVFFLRVRAAVVATRRGEERQRRSVPARGRWLRDSSCERRVRMGVDQGRLLLCPRVRPEPNPRRSSPGLQVQKKPTRHDLFIFIFLIVA